MIEILENATIVYNDGVKEQFEAVCLANNKVITGRILKEGKKEKFVDYGFISKRNIKHIYNGCKRKIQRLRS